MGDRLHRDRDVHPAQADRDLLPVAAQRRGAGDRRPRDPRQRGLPLGRADARRAARTGVARRGHAAGGARAPRQPARTSSGPARPPHGCAGPRKRQTAAVPLRRGAGCSSRDSPRELASAKGQGLAAQARGPDTRAVPLVLALARQDGARIAEVGFLRFSSQGYGWWPPRSRDWASSTPGSWSRAFCSRPPVCCSSWRFTGVISARTGRGLPGRRGGPRASAGCGAAGAGVDAATRATRPGS